MQRLQDHVKKARLFKAERGTVVGTEKYVNMANFASANLFVGVNVGTSDEEAILTVKQAQDAAGTGEKALTFTRAASTDFDVSANATALTSLNSSIRMGVSTGDKLYQINIQDTDLDVANGFDFIRVDVGSSMADAVFSGYADLYHARHTGGVAKFPASS